MKALVKISAEIFLKIEKVEGEESVVTYPLGEEVYKEVTDRFFKKHSADHKLSWVWKFEGVVSVGELYEYLLLKTGEKIEITVVELIYERNIVSPKAPSTNHTQSFNEKVNIHISDIGLLQMNEVVVYEDMCTNELRRELEDGWRILSICPQPDQRRPDYILGRHEK